MSVARRWESLDGCIIDDAYDGTGVLNRPGEGSIVLNCKENCDSLVKEHNALLDAYEALEDELRGASRRIRSLAASLRASK